jgi:hypothetical protein
MKTDDVPRQVAADLGWIQQIIGYINVVLPFIRPFELGRLKSSYDPGRAKLFMFRIFRDLTNSGINLLRCHMMMGYHVVGMLSSSWQGGNIMGGQRKEVIERLERERRAAEAEKAKAKKDKPTRN